MAIGVYRTKTYLAGDWTGDSDAIQQIMTWNDGNKWGLHFVDVHKYAQCYDTSMPCTIKDSLRDRMNVSKKFVLIVGDSTKTTRKGSCAYKDCGNKMYDFWYNTYTCKVIGKTYNTQSFIEYECELAHKAWLRGELEIIVLYNAASVNTSKCPDILHGVGKHESMKSWNPIWNKYTFDYQRVKKAIEG